MMPVGQRFADNFEPAVSSISNNIDELFYDTRQG